MVSLRFAVCRFSSHGGQFFTKKAAIPVRQKIPLPVIGTVINVLRKTTGISPQDIQNKQYRLRKENQNYFTETM
jgi:predicted nucleic acid-binding protein